MDIDCFASLTRILRDCSRRRFLTLAGVAAGGIASPFGPAVAEAKKRKKKRKKKQQQTPQPAPPPALTYACAGPPESFGTFLTINRVAQVFVAERSGTLRRIEFLVENLEGDSGDYAVQLLRVDDGTPLPLATHILAGISIPQGEVPVGESTLAGSFQGPQLTAGTEYAAAIGRLVSPVRLGNVSGTGNVCAGQTFTSQGGAFSEATGTDVMVSVFVD